jgi:hypothetical protein
MSPARIASTASGAGAMFRSAISIAGLTALMQALA